MFCYIDPGTGSMLFTILVGLVTAGLYGLKALKVKLSFALNGGKSTSVDKQKIPYVIFSDSKRYWNVFKPICDEMDRRGLECQYWTASLDDPALKENYKTVKCLFIGEGNQAFAKLNSMNACVCLSTTPDLDVVFWKRSKNTNFYVHTLHEVGGVTEYRMFGLDFYDAVLLSGSYQANYIRELENKRSLKTKDLCVVGSTYMDSMAERVVKLPKHEKNSVPTVLLAPSWGPSSILEKYGEAFLQKLVDTGFNVICRPHPQSKIATPQLLEKLEKAFPSIEWNYDNDNLAVLNRSDILISDFSGVIFDYAFIFDGPVMYADAQLDNSIYDSSWIDEEVWRFRAVREMGRKLEEKDFDNLGKIIPEMLSDKSLAAKRISLKDEAWEFQGQGAVRTVDYLEKKYLEINKAKS